MISLLRIICNKARMVFVRSAVYHELVYLSCSIRFSIME